MTILAIVQTRTSSSLMPNKVLLLISRKAMISYQLECLRRSRCPDRIVVATSADVFDDELTALVKAAGFSTFAVN